MSDSLRGPQVLVGAQVNAVTFVMDYVQVHFNGPVFTFLIPVYIQSPDEQLVFPGPGGRDALCELIGAEVASIRADAEVIELKFQNGRILRAPVSGEHRTGPEAAHFQARVNDPLMVW
jgi:hypothetical protein